MDTAQVLKRTIVLNATPSQVWQALTNPALTKQYMFNCEAYSTWKVGSPIIWKGNFQGYESGEKGVILSYVKEKQLKYSSIDPNFGIKDLPENYLHITYDLVEQNGHTELTTTIENFNNDANRMADVARGWDNIVLPAIKKLFQ